MHWGLLLIRYCPIDVYSVFERENTAKIPLTPNWFKSTSPGGPSIDHPGC